MNADKTLFAQTMGFISSTSFARIVERYSGNAGIRRITCAADQYNYNAQYHISSGDHSGLKPPKVG